MTEFDLPDVNVLVALLHPSHVHHRQATEWFAATTRFATTPVTESGFLRVALSPAVSAGAADFNAARASLGSLRSHSRAHFLADDTSLSDPHIRLDQVTGYRQVTDLHLVNLAAANSARLVTLDRRIIPTLDPAASALVHQLIP